MALLPLCDLLNLGSSQRKNRGHRMRKRTLFITDSDVQRLRNLIGSPGPLESRDQEALRSLEGELSRAQIVAPEEIPPDVVTMHSTVVLTDLKTGEEETYTLVFPSDADLDQRKISVLAPIGTAMLGYRVGDTFIWSVPGGERHLRVKKVIYQPEASGDWHL